MLKQLLTAAVAASAAFATVSAPGLTSGAVVAVLPAAPAAGLAVRALPDPGQLGMLRVARLYQDGTPAADLATVTVYHLAEDAAGGALDLATNAGWQRAAALSLDEALEVPRGPARAEATVGGVVVFTDLPLGVFLVTSTYTDTGVEASAPFVITIPQTNAAGDGWVYEVEAFPKAGEPLAHLGGVVWYDANANGLFDEGEETVEGVRVTVFNGQSPLARAVVGVTYTDEEGWWEFTYLPVDVKIVRFDLDPINNGGEYFEFTLPGLDSDADPETGYADPVQLIARDWVFVDAGVVYTNNDETVIVPPTPDPTPTPEASPTPSPSPTPPGGGNVGGRPDLPVTGATIAGVLLLGTGALTGGLFLKLGAKRRRAETDSPAV
ncbi:MAG: pilin N-terminal domain-containing protein [Promicromonosporaceae bacterium]|nr:pilin N-terminal domain-containing protein [Promicromonosporaceae bacterium]